MSGIANRTLFHADNLDVLRGIDTGTIHLIATDPPFNKGRDFHATPESLAKGASFQDRWSWKDDVHDEWIDQLEDDWPTVWSTIQGSRDSWGDDMGAFLCFMAVRILEMHRVLRPDGSMYLHCDPTASHYLKALMDSIFGRENFRSEIIWQRYSGRAKGSQHVSQSFGVDDDRLLFYARTAKTKLIHPYVKLSQDEIEQRYPKTDAKGRRYTGIAHFRGINMGTRPNLCYEWRGFKNPHPSGWRVSKERLEAEYQDGKVVVHSNGRLERRRFFDPEKGIKIGSIWTDIQPPAGEESTGYPTQKPLALYERIIKASSNSGDIVLDAFCGCATTCVAAERLGRQWIGIDIWDGAHEVTISRLKKEGFLAGPDDNRPDLLITEG